MSSNRGQRDKPFLEFRLTAAPAAEPLRAALADAGLARAVAASAEPHVVVGFGAAAWQALSPDEVPTGLRPFEAIAAADGGAPATQNDLWFWLHGARRDEVFDSALAIGRALGQIATLAVDQPGFVYRDLRDLTGFIDGTENPKGEERPEVALIPEGEAGGGGSYVLAQRWVHDLEAFNRLPVDGQERVIGRTKDASVQLAAEVMPEDSHVSRVDAKRNGEPVELYRRSVPYGTVAEHGLYFLAFAADSSRFGFLLGRMFGTREDGIRDRLTRFSRPVTGSIYLALSTDALTRALGARPG